MSPAAWTWLAIASISLLLNARDHGKPKTGKDSFWHSLIGLAILGSILYWGGFFATVPK